MHATATTSDSSQLNQEWHLLRTANPNVLMVGPDAAVVDALHTLRGVYREPVATCRAASSLVLPPPATTGALILRDVGNLTPEGQRCLMAWLEDACGRMQVIATSADAVWPRVKDGSFLEVLYYRLNVIYIDLTDGHHSRDGQALPALNERLLRN